MILLFVILIIILSQYARIMKHNYFCILLHVFITLQCHYPLFVCGCVKQEFPQDLGCAISKLSAFVCWIMSKEIHVASIPRWNQEIVEIVYIFEKEMPTSFMDLQVHLLIHIVDEVELVGVVFFIGYSS